MGFLCKDDLRVWQPPEKVYLLLWLSPGTAACENGGYAGSNASTPRRHGQPCPGHVRRSVNGSSPPRQPRASQPGPFFFPLRVSSPFWRRRPSPRVSSVSPGAPAPLASVCHRPPAPACALEQRGVSAYRAGPFPRLRGDAPAAALSFALRSLKASPARESPLNAFPRTRQPTPIPTAFVPVSIIIVGSPTRHWGILRRAQILSAPSPLSPLPSALRHSRPSPSSPPPAFLPLGRGSTCTAERDPSLKCNVVGQRGSPPPLHAPFTVELRCDRFILCCVDGRLRMCSGLSGCERLTLAEGLCSIPGRQGSNRRANRNGSFCGRAPLLANVGLPTTLSHPLGPPILSRGPWLVRTREVKGLSEPAGLSAALHVPVLLSTHHSLSLSLRVPQTGMGSSQLLSSPLLSRLLFYSILASLLFLSFCSLALLISDPLLSSPLPSRPPLLSSVPTYFLLSSPLRGVGCSASLEKDTQIHRVSKHPFCGNVAIRPPEKRRENETKTG